VNFDSNNLKFANPLAVFYLDNPTKELVEQIVQGSTRLTAAQVPEFVGLAATVLKTYKARQDNNKDADIVCLLNLLIRFRILFFIRKSKNFKKLFQNFSKILTKMLVMLQQLH
jgi:hypothetical protein